MDKVINLRIPHIGEQIFASIDTHHVVQFLQVSKAWRVIAEKVLNTKDHEGANAFYLACKNGNEHHVRLMLENSDNIDVESMWTPLMWTPFFRACRHGQTSIVSMLLDYADTKRIDLNVRSKSWSITPFGMACYQGHIDVVKLLLDYKGNASIDFNARDKKEETFLITPFIRAYESGSTELVKLLLDYAVEKKLDLSLRDVPCPYQFLRQPQQPIINLLQHVRVCLIEGDWRFGLQLACSDRRCYGVRCYGDNEGAVKLLLEFSEKKDPVNHSGNVRAALIRASKCKQQNIVKLILTHAEEKNIQIDCKSLLDVAMNNDIHGHISQEVKGISEEIEKLRINPAAKDENSTE